MNRRFLRIALAVTAVGSLQACNNEEPRAALVLDRTAIDFGDVLVETAVQRAVLIRNAGKATLLLTRVSRGEPFDAGFDFSLDRMSVAAGEVAELKVTFAPQAGGPAAGVIRIQSNDPDQVIREIIIQGNGLSYDVVAEPTSLSFGNAVVGSSKSMTFALRNDGTSIARISLDEPGTLNGALCSDATDATIFCARTVDPTLRLDPGFDLKPGESQMIEVQFFSKLAGAPEQGTLSLRTCGSEGACRAAVQLDGTGVDSTLLCAPLPLDFGLVNPGACGSESVSCQNVSGAPLTIDGWSIRRDSSPAFATATPGAAIELDDGESVDIPVTYCPETLGADEGDLDIETQHANPRLKFIEVGLVGTGGGADIDFLPGELDFGLVSLVAPARRTVSIQNVGFAPLEIYEVIADIEGTGAFSAPGTVGGLLEAGEFLQVTIEFQPNVVGPIEATLLIRSGDQDEPELSIRMTGEGINVGPCQFEVAPSALDFGAVESDRFGTQSFEIRNTGGNVCVVTGARTVPGSDASFSLPGPPLHSLLIAPGSAHSVAVDFVPRNSRDHSGQVEFSISSATSPFNDVSLAGTGQDLALVLMPPQIDFATSQLGCATPPLRKITIFNTDDEPATLHAVDIVGNNADFEIVSAPNLPGEPVNIAPGADVEFLIRFTPSSEGTYSASLSFEGMSAGSPVTLVAGLEAEASGVADRVEEHRQLGNAMVDILMVVDHSGCNGQEHALLAERLPALLQLARSLDVDYQVGITTTDTDDERGRLVHPAGVNAFGGDLANRIITEDSMPSPEVAIADHIPARNQTGGGAGDEAGLEAARLALTAPVRSGHNAGFLRRNAGLALIVMSDEPEQSQLSVPSYIDYFRSLKDPKLRHRVAISSISGDNPGGCSGPNGNATSSPRMADAVEQTDGAFMSYCSIDWTADLAPIFEGAVGIRSIFRLENVPVADTIEVRVDGVLLPAPSPGGITSWIYDQTRNAVVFEAAALPAPRSDIRISYGAVCQ